MDSNRDLFCPETPSLKVPELVELALAALGLPVVVSDSIPVSLTCCQDQLLSYPHL